MAIFTATCSVYIIHQFRSETTFQHTRQNKEWTEFYPHVMVREKKSKTSRRAVHPMSLPLQSEEHPPRKRIWSNTVAAHLDHSTQDTSNCSILTGNEHSGKTSVHPILLVRPVTLPDGTVQTIWHPPSLLQILSHPTPNLVR